MAIRTKTGRSTSTTRSGTKVALILLALLVPGSLAADTVLVPIVARIHGQNDVSWTTEVRITNRTSAPLHFSITDWIGTPGIVPATYTIAPHSTTSLGGSDVFGVPWESAYGLAICTAEAGLFVQSAILSGISTGGVTEQCPSYDGGGSGCPGLSGAGPLIDGLSFANPGAETIVPWLHTEEFRRTNLVLINPDDAPANVTVTITSQDGSSVVPSTFVLPARSYNQLNDLFAQEPWSAIRQANQRIPHIGGGAAASAAITSDRRLLAMSYVISNNNNSLTISLPR